MAIQTVNNMNQIFKTYDMKNWTSNIERGQNVKINDGFGKTSIERGENKTFGQFLVESMAKVNELQSEANVAMQKVASGESKNLHETLLAIEKADIAFKTMNQVRLKVVDAYKEVMRMQV